MMKEINRIVGHLAKHVPLCSMFVSNGDPIRLFRRRREMMDFYEYNEVISMYSENKPTDILCFKEKNKFLRIKFTFDNAFVRVFFKIRSSFAPLP